MLLAKTHHHQSSLANYCRTGTYVAIPGVIQENLHHYRRLVFNNVMDSLTTAYPLTKKLFGKKKWQNTVERFFSNYKVQSPQIWYMPKEFKVYMEEFESELLLQYPFLIDLLTFEWLEVEVFMMPDQDLKVEVKNHFYLNPETKLIHVSYPVHLKKAKKIEATDRGDYFMAIHRNPETGSVHFTNLAVPYVDVLEQLSEESLSKENIKQILNQYVDLSLVELVLENFLTQSIDNKLLYYEQ